MTGHLNQPVDPLQAPWLSSSSSSLVPPCRLCEACRMVEKQAVLMVLLGVFVFGYVMLAGSPVLGREGGCCFSPPELNRFLIHWTAKRFSVVSSSSRLRVFPGAFRHRQSVLDWWMCWSLFFLFIFFKEFISLLGASALEFLVNALWIETAASFAYFWTVFFRCRLYSNWTSNAYFKLTICCVSVPFVHLLGLDEQYTTSVNRQLIGQFQMSLDLSPL